MPIGQTVMGTRDGRIRIEQYWVSGTPYLRVERDGILIGHKMTDHQQVLDLLAGEPYNLDAADLVLDPPHAQPRVPRQDPGPPRRRHSTIPPRRATR